MAFCLRKLPSDRLQARIPTGSVVDELDELDAVDGRQRRGRPAPDLLVEPQERALAVAGDPAGGGSAKIVAEDLVARLIGPW
jgi:hypothetical protein